MISKEQLAESIRVMLEDGNVDAVLMLPIRTDGTLSTSIMVVDSSVDQNKIDPDRVIRTMQTLATAAAEHARVVAGIGDSVNDSLHLLGTLARDYTKESDTC